MSHIIILEKKNKIRKHRKDGQAVDKTKLSIVNTSTILSCYNTYLQVSPVQLP